MCEPSCPLETVRANFRAAEKSRKVLAFGERRIHHCRTRTTIRRLRR